MDAVVFVLKSFVVTVAILFLMQIRVGNSTVERKTLAWMRQSVVVDGIRYVADGAVTLTSKGYQAVHSLVASPSHSESSTAQASRGYSWEVKRSDAYNKQQAKKHELEKAFNEDGASDNGDIIENDSRVTGPTGDEVD